MKEGRTQTILGKRQPRKEGRKEGSNRGERVGKNERKEGHETRRNKECDLLFLFHVFPLHVGIIMVVLLCARLLPKFPLPIQACTGVKWCKYITQYY